MESTLKFLSVLILSIMFISFASAITIEEKTEIIFNSIGTNMNNIIFINLITLIGEWRNKAIQYETQINWYKENWEPKHRCGSSIRTETITNTITETEIICPEKTSKQLLKSWETWYPSTECSEENCYCEGTDTNKDGDVDGNDFLDLQNNYG